jgi:hypothetical protein
MSEDQVPHVMRSTPANTTMPGALVYRGTTCHCVRPEVTQGQPRAPYLVVDAATGEVLGTLVWDQRERGYLVRVEAGTSWSSRDLSEVALWVRRLSRDAARR